ncbi:excalibur calcium-binding domain-containing protein [Mycobacterium sp. CBMA247]|nr:excalibur calcium-binding domain-containing protein [Mycolicibacterium sp. CBMA 329]MUL90968.1 excalibur calcium-binding domain-containing protein [Mycolicibacterium sp. CBMA 331]MUL98361.1 excalibur calcium-binding domain-containing protein [Mycolicibacterium sp. CBMA 334]MUM28586.1 excalibur calcium-binding domain-containing protein [Mycolicibacterium sp. CBMA 295]MUM40727.1 excalibur calcium-binding domain-containing protein [Mycolicibacterium sp. CBMA 247]MUM46923.1 excalibur calcium-bi
MRLIALALASAAATTGLITASIANAYPNCAAARAAGAAPLYAGQPGYSRKLDRDGDGVACETGGGSVSSGGGLPLYGGAPVATGPATGGGGYTTVVNWTGANCIDITAPSGPAGTLQTGTHCGGQATLFSSGVGDQMVGADPIIGDAGSLACEILSGRLMDSGTAGDGHDVNCLTRASALP